MSLAGHYSRRWWHNSCRVCRRRHGTTAAVDELILDGEVAVLVALSALVDLAEGRVVVHGQPTVAALVHDPHCDGCARHIVRHHEALAAGVLACGSNGAAEGRPAVLLAP